MKLKDKIEELKEEQTSGVFEYFIRLAGDIDAASVRESGLPIKEYTFEIPLEKGEAELNLDLVNEALVAIENDSK